MDIFLPVMESATVLAAHYAKACGRDVVLAEDMRMGLMYAARNVTGKHVGTLYPEIYDEEDEDEDEDGSWETVSEGEFAWTRYDGQDNELALSMNECERSWSEWSPDSPAECAIKNAVDKYDN